MCYRAAPRPRVPPKTTSAFSMCTHIVGTKTFSFWRAFKRYRFPSDSFSRFQAFEATSEQAMAFASWEICKFSNEPTERAYWTSLLNEPTERAYWMSIPNAPTKFAAIPTQWLSVASRRVLSQAKVICFRCSTRRPQWLNGNQFLNAEKSLNFFHIRRQSASSFLVRFLQVQSFEWVFLYGFRMQPWVSELFDFLRRNLGFLRPFEYPSSECHLKECHLNECHLNECHPYEHLISNILMSTIRITTVSLPAPMNTPFA